MKQNLSLSCIYRYTFVTYRIVNNNHFETVFKKNPDDNYK